MAEEAVKLYTAFNLPPEEAIEYFAKKGYATTWNWQELWQEAHHQAFTVAKVMNLDFLTEIRQEVERAIREGKSFEEFFKALLPAFQRHGWMPEDWPAVKSVEITGPGGKKAKVGPWRLRTIYRTNIKNAIQIGRYKQMTDPDVIRRRPYWQYLSILDARTTPACRRRNGEIHRADDPWWDLNYPQNHWL